jgi:hypothetical protein
MLAEKPHAHELIERLPADRISTVVRFMEFMLLDPVSRAVITAQEDDEPVIEEDRRRLRNGQSWFAERGGRGISMEEILAEHGLKPEDVAADK